jgi:hypothetical protein
MHRFPPRSARRDVEGSGFRQRAGWLAAPAALSLVFATAACGSSSEPAQSTGGSSPEAVSGAQITGGEVKLVSAVRPTIDALIDALQGEDVARARAAFADYDAAWNGVEVYVNVRDISLYEHLEEDLEGPIGEGLEADKPDLGAQVPKAKALGTAFDEAIANSKKGPALSPLFDDVTALRIVRRDLRRTTALLEAGDVAGARRTFTAFRRNYPQVQERVTVRSDTADAPITAALAAAAKGFATPHESASALTPLVASVTDRYGFALSLWNAAARNADLSKKAFTDGDVDAVGSLRTLEKATTKGLELWKEGNFTAAKASVQQAQTAYAAVHPALTAKGTDSAADSDEALKTALDTFSPMVAAEGEPAVATVAGSLVTQAAQVAEQVVVGQFWTDADLQQELAKHPA